MAVVGDSLFAIIFFVQTLFLSSDFAEKADDGKVPVIKKKTVQVGTKWAVCRLLLEKQSFLTAGCDVIKCEKVASCLRKAFAEHKGIVDELSRSRRSWRPATRCFTRWKWWSKSFWKITRICCCILFQLLLRAFLISSDSSRCNFTTKTDSNWSRFYRYLLGMNFVEAKIKLTSTQTQVCQCKQM